MTAIASASRGWRAHAGFAWTFAFAGALLAQEAYGVQAAAFLDVTLDNGVVVSLPVVRDRGFAAVPSGALSTLGWTPREAPVGETLLAHTGGATLRLWAGSPMLVLDDDLLQMADPTYSGGDVLYVPLQLIVDLIPIFGPAGYMTDRGQVAAEPGSTDPALDVALVDAAPIDAAPVDVTSGVDDAPATDLAADVDTVLAGTDSVAVAAGDVGVGAVDAAPGAATLAVASSAPPPPSAYDLVRGGERLVVIDAGHGGADTGTVGPGGATEKGIALSVALALARELASRPGLDVRVTRDRDIEVAPEYRGAWASEWKGDRPGVFVSIHANSLPDRTGVRGFETYSPGCAMSEREIRVAEIENGTYMRDDDPTDASLVGCGAPGPSELQRLSEDLAFRVQQELGTFHPGQDRGVLKGSFPALTAAQMPAVLIEVGFLTNREEERALASPAFHRQAAAAIGRALDQYFENNPSTGLP